MFAGSNMGVKAGCMETRTKSCLTPRIVFPSCSAALLELEPVGGAVLDEVVLQDAPPAATQDGMVRAATVTRTVPQLPPRNKGKGRTAPPQLP